MSNQQNDIYYENKKEMKEETDMYKCPSYYDDDGVMKDCSCGRCENEDKVQKYARDYAGKVLDREDLLSILCSTYNAGFCKGMASIKKLSSN